MSLLPDSASFHERVQDCFVAYRGRGLALSAHDVDLLDEWAGAGVPVEVVIRGVRKAAEAALFDAPQGEGALRSLRACRRRVDAEISHYLKLSAGKTAAAEPGGEDPFLLTRQKKLKAALKKLGGEKPALSPAVARWLATVKEPQDFEASNRQEEFALALLTRAIPHQDRLTILREARRLVENAPTSSRSARRESLRFHRAALVRQRLELPSFW